MIDTRSDAAKLRAAGDHLRKGAALIGEVLDRGEAPIPRITPGEEIRPEDLQGVRRFGVRRIPLAGAIGGSTA